MAMALKSGSLNISPFSYMNALILCDFHFSKAGHRVMHINDARPAVQYNFKQNRA